MLAEQACSAQGLERLAAQPSRLQAKAQAQGASGRARRQFGQLAPGAVEVAFLGHRLDPRQGLRLAAQVAKRRGLKVAWQRTQDNGAVACSPTLTARLEQSVKAVQGRSLSLVSGAGHDGVVMSALCPIAMLFVRCRDGLSHHPDEYASPKDLAVALKVMIDFLERLAVEHRK